MQLMLQNASIYTASENRVSPFAIAEMLGDVSAQGTASGSVNWQTAPALLRFRRLDPVVKTSTHSRR